MLSHLQVEWQATLVTLSGSQTLVVKQHLPLGAQEANVVVNVLLANMMDTFDQFLGQSDDDELLLIGGLQKGNEWSVHYLFSFSSAVD